jgi:hypothetical protein
MNAAGNLVIGDPNFTYDGATLTLSDNYTFTGVGTMSGVTTWTSGGIVLNDTIPLTFGTNAAPDNYQIEYSGTEMVFNEDGIDTDLRIEGATGSTNSDILFVVDAGSNSVMVGHSASPTAKLDIRETVGAVFGRGLNIQVTQDSLENLNVQGALINVIHAFDHTAGNALNYLGFENRVTLKEQVSGAGSITMRAVDNILNFDFGTATTVATAEGARFDLRVASGSPSAGSHTITNYNGLNLKGTDSGGSLSIGTAKIINVETLPNYGGTLTTASNIWLNPQSNFSTAYGIVLNGDGAGSNIVIGANQANDIRTSDDSARILHNNRDIQSYALMGVC